METFRSGDCILGLVLRLIILLPSSGCLGVCLPSQTADDFPKADERRVRAAVDEEVRWLIQNPVPAENHRKGADYP